MKKIFKVFTKNRYELVEITEEVQKAVEESQVKEGLCLLFLPHSTAGILITENEEGLKGDWLKVLKKIVSGFDFEHNKIDDNADSHILSGLLGQGKVLIIESGKIFKGPWQQIFLAEFDGPREREINIFIKKC